jgi:PIN domain
VIYIDSSVALADVLAEFRSPPASLWASPLVSSRLLQYEVWNRMHAYGVGETGRTEMDAVLRKIAMIELTASALDRALHPFPVTVRTLDSLHLATMDFLRQRGETVELASYDNRLIAAARALGMPLVDL